MLTFIISDSMTGAVGMRVWLFSLTTRERKSSAGELISMVTFKSSTQGAYEPGTHADKRDKIVRK